MKVYGIQNTGIINFAKKKNKKNKPVTTQKDSFVAYNKTPYAWAINLLADSLLLDSKMDFYANKGTLRAHLLGASLKKRTASDDSKIFTVKESVASNEEKRSVYTAKAKSGVVSAAKKYDTLTKQTDVLIKTDSDQNLFAKNIEDSEIGLKADEVIIYGKQDKQPLYYVRKFSSFPIFDGVQAESVYDLRPETCGAQRMYKRLDDSSFEYRNVLSKIDASLKYKTDF